MAKNQIIILGVVSVLILAWIISGVVFQEEKLPIGEQIGPEEKEIEEVEEVVEKEVFSLSGKVSSVSAENNFLMVKPANQDKEVKVVISDTTKLAKLKLLFDPTNPDDDSPRTAEQIEIGISDFEEGDSIFIKTKENIVGKTEFDNVDFIHILP